MKLSRKRKNQEINLSGPTFHTKVLEKSECKKNLPQKTIQIQIVAFLDLFKKDSKNVLVNRTLQC